MYTTKLPLLFSSLTRCIKETDIIKGKYNISHIFSSLHPELIAVSPILTIGYAHKLGSRFLLGEPSLKTPSHVYVYLMELSLKGNIQQEKIIATSDIYSYAYALNILKGRFELGEKVIAESTFYSYMYTRLTKVDLN